jgi:hypothetical protein
VGQALAVFLLALGSVYVEMAVLLSYPYGALVPAAGILAAAGLAVQWKLHRERSFLVAWLVVSVSFAVFSAVTGVYNGLTDEPYATPAFAAQWWPNLYAKPALLTYSEYGAPLNTLSVYYVYLPLLTLFQVPGLDYRWVTLLAWGASLYLLRRNGTAIVLWGSLYVGLLAANGFNDFVPFVFLTLAFLSLTGWPGKVAEVVSLGLKQLANLFVVAYHLYHRRWRSAALAVVVTFAFLAPFLLVSPLRVWCGAFLIGSQSCTGFVGSLASNLTSGGAPPIYSHLNYYLWPLWVVAVFAPRWAARTHRPEYRSSRERAAAVLGRTGAAAAVDSDDVPFLLVLWAVRLRMGLAPRRSPG